MAVPTKLANIIPLNGSLLACYTTQIDAEIENKWVILDVFHLPTPPCVAYIVQGSWCC